MVRKLVVGFIVCLGVFAAWAAPSLAATYTVTSTQDADAVAPASGCATALADGACTLRSAVEAAEAQGGASTITLAAGTYTLSAGEITLDDTAGNSPVVTITGAGSATTIVQGDGSHRILELDSGATATITGVTFTGGDAADATSCGNDTAEAQGGAILDEGDLTLDSDVVENSLSAGAGGGVADLSTDALEISDSTFTGNSACDSNDSRGIGGAVSEVGGSDVTITDSTMTGNYAEDEGGAFAELGGGSDTITGSTLDTNSAQYSGGAVAADESVEPEQEGVANPGQVTFDADTLSGNSVGEQEAGATSEPGGGAVFILGDATSFANSTIAGNTSAMAPGGGIAIVDTPFSTPGSATVSFSTVTGNSGDGEIAVGAGGNLAVEGEEYAEVVGQAPALRSHPDIAPDPSADGITLDNSIVTGGQDLFTQTTSNCEQEQGPEATTGLINSSGFNVYDDTSCPTLPSDQTLAGGTKVVDALADNGGPTQTEALFAGSAALNAASSLACAAETGTPAVDQRGVSRPQGPACDVGAYELEFSPDLTLTATPNPASIAVGGSSVVTDTITNAGAGAATGVTFTDPSSGPYTFTGASSPQGPCTTTASTVSCSLGTLAPGATATVTIDVVGTAAGTITLDSAVSEDQTDPTPANNLATAQITVTAPDSTPTTSTPTTPTPTTPTPSAPTTPSATATPPAPATPAGTTKPLAADLAITKTVSHTSVRTGEQVSYTLRITNHGPSTSTGVVVTDELPSQETLVSGSVAGAACTVTGRTLRCALGSLRAAKHAIITYKVRTAGTGTLVNHARVTAKTHDPNLNNNAAAATVKVTAPPVLMCLAKAAFADTYDPSGKVNFVQVWRDGKLVATVSGVNVRHVTVTPPRHAKSFTLKVVFYETNEATATQTRSYRGCKPGMTHTSTTAPVPPADQS